MWIQYFWLSVKDACVERWIHTALLHHHHHHHHWWITNKQIGSVCAVEILISAKFLNRCLFIFACILCVKRFVYFIYSQFTQNVLGIFPYVLNDATWHKRPDKNYEFSCRIIKWWTFVSSRNGISLYVYFACIRFECECEIRLKYRRANRQLPYTKDVIFYLL